MKDQIRIKSAKKIENLSRLVGRKKFFGKFGKGLLGLVLVNSFPFKLFGKNILQNKIEIKINPLAVKRTRDGFK